jgi:hypothetical protein
MLVRIKPRKKTGSSSIQMPADQNPHSTVFAQQLRGAMSSAWQRANRTTLG